MLISFRSPLNKDLVNLQKVNLDQGEWVYSSDPSLSPKSEDKNLKEEREEAKFIQWYLYDEVQTSPLKDAQSTPGAKSGSE